MYLLVAIQALSVGNIITLFLSVFEQNSFMILLQEQKF